LSLFSTSVLQWTPKVTYLLRLRKGRTEKANVSETETTAVRLKTSKFLTGTIQAQKSKNHKFVRSPF
jgi:hypothetical protein